MVQMNSAKQRKQGCLLEGDRFEDKFEHCLHSIISYSIVPSLIVSEDIKESTIKYFFWYLALNQDRVLDSGGALYKKDKFLFSLNFDFINSEREIDILICEIYAKLCH